MVHRTTIETLYLQNHTQDKDTTDTKELGRGGLKEARRGIIIQTITIPGRSTEVKKGHKAKEENHKSQNRRDTLYLFKGRGK